MDAAKLSKPLLRAIAQEASRAYPAEACGLLFAERSGELRFVPVPNVAGTPGARDTSARGQRDGYVMDPGVLLPVLEAAESSGEPLAAIVHSHPDVGAYFSAEDRDVALGGGVSPLWPEVDYLVISCKQGRVDDARLYRWDASAEDFMETQISEIADL
ncbi:MAG: Mov34/MPN/PAD-1 family protein [Myxococcales bacterium]